MTNKFEILPGLPTFGELPIQFSSTGMGMHREGFVVEFFPENRASWIGNFQRAGTTFDIALQHPNGSWVIVVAGGDGYVVDVENKSLIESFGGDFVSVVPITEKSLLLFGSYTGFEAVNATGRIWHSRRISWDGIRNVQVNGDTLNGEAWSFEDIWMPFSLNVNTGEHTGGPQTIGGL